MAKFFGERQPAAILKHAILEKYLPVYINKTGSNSWKNRVAYIDGFAGPGLYDDGTEGSPAVAVDTARALAGMASARQVDGHLVEQNPDSCAALRDYLKAEGLDWTVYEGDVQQHLSTILDALPASEASFFFLDPFGLGVPFDMLGTIMARAGELKYGYRAEGAATELLLNFSLPGLWRNAGHLTSPKTYASKQTFINKADASMGGTWWKAIWKDNPKGERDQLILRHYIEKLIEVCKGSGHVSWIPCADRWQGPPSYFLIHVTQHPQGAWLFNQAVSSAMEVYREHCLQDKDRDLFDDLSVREAEWIAIIKANIARLLESDGAFTVVERMGEVYGETHGFAREKHVRKAINELHKEGRTPTESKGDIATKRIKPT